MEVIYIKDISASFLSEEVNKKIREGYSLYGNVVFNSFINEGRRVIHKTYIQCMIKGE